MHLIITASISFIEIDDWGPVSPLLRLLLFVHLLAGYVFGDDSPLPQAILRRHVPILSPIDMQATSSHPHLGTCCRNLPDHGSAAALHNPLLLHLLLQIPNQVILKIPRHLVTLLNNLGSQRRKLCFLLLRVITLLPLFK